MSYNKRSIVSRKRRVIPPKNLDSLSKMLKINKINYTTKLSKKRGVPSQIRPHVALPTIPESIQPPIENPSHPTLEKTQLTPNVRLSDVQIMAEILPKIVKHFIQYKNTNSINNSELQTKLENQFPEILNAFFVDMFIEIHPEYKEIKDKLLQPSFKQVIINSVLKIKNHKNGGKSTRKRRH